MKKTSAWDTPVYPRSSLLLEAPRSSPPHGAIREFRCPLRWLSSIGFRVIGWRTEEQGSEEGYREAPHVAMRGIFPDHKLRGVVKTRLGQWTKTYTVSVVT